jgi:hypothetical protein
MDACEAGEWLDNGWQMWGGGGIQFGDVEACLVPVHAAPDAVQAWLVKHSPWVPQVTALGGSGSSPSCSTWQYSKIRFATLPCARLGFPFNSELNFCPVFCLVWRQKIERSSTDGCPEGIINDHEVTRDKTVFRSRRRGKIPRLKLRVLLIPSGAHISRWSSCKHWRCLQWRRAFVGKHLVPTPWLHRSSNTITTRHRRDSGSVCLQPGEVRLAFSWPAI